MLTAPTSTIACVKTALKDIAEHLGKLKPLFGLPPLALVEDSVDCYALEKIFNTETRR